MKQKAREYLDSFLYGVSGALDIWGTDDIDMAQRLVAPGGFLRDWNALADDCNGVFQTLTEHSGGRGV